MGPYFIIREIIYSFVSIIVLWKLLKWSWFSSIPMFLKHGGGGLQGILIKCFATKIIVSILDESISYEDNCI